MDGLWTAIEQLTASIARVRAVNVNADVLRDQARSLAQSWFREHRPACVVIGADPQQLEQIDRLVQDLLRLANGRNPKKSYVKVLRTLRESRPLLETHLDMLHGQARQPAALGRATTLEAGIIRTLERMLPNAALSYQQVLADVAGTVRFSYRGTATELREVVREVLDHLAPDSDVLGSPGFKLEKDRRAPTMKQKARFILKARGVGESSRTAPEQSVELLEDQIASLARSVYERGSASTHGATMKGQVLSFKGYADAVLAELLQLHGTL